MKQILLSTDGPLSLYEVPDRVAKNLHKYCLDFCDWAHSGPKSKEFRKYGYHCEKEFIDYLNTVVNPNFLEKARFIKELGYIDDESDLPEKYRKLPYFNF